MKVELTIPGNPVPWQRARRNGKRYFPEPSTAEFQERVKTAWRVEGRLTVETEPVQLTARFYLQRPKAHFGTGRNSQKLKPGAPLFPRCDLDNLIKGPLDALNGCLYTDDSQVVRIVQAWKLWAGPGEEPRTELEFETL